jgi:DNA-binding transcriptional MerR regulator
MQKFSIGQASKLVKLPQSVLRYWETVFKQLKPQKTPGGTRKYSEDDIQTILQIKELLYEKKYTIAGARSKLSDKVRVVSDNKNQQLSEYVVDELERILKLLESG